MIVREVPFGVAAKDTKRSLYRLADPFLRLWFRVVAPHRAALTVADTKERRRMLDAHVPALTAATFEELARRSVPALGAWEAAGRWWQGSSPEWDVVSQSPDGALLVGEVKAWSRPATASAVRSEASRLSARQLPELTVTPRRVERVLFVPSLATGVKAQQDGVRVVTLEGMLAALKRSSG